MAIWIWFWDCKDYRHLKKHVSENFKHNKYKTWFGYFYIVYQLAYDVVHTGTGYRLRVVLGGLTLYVFPYVPIATVSRQLMCLIPCLLLTLLVGHADYSFHDFGIASVGITWNCHVRVDREAFAAWSWV